MAKKKVVVARLGSVKAVTRGNDLIGQDEMDSSPLYRQVG